MHLTKFRKWKKWKKWEIEVCPWKLYLLSLSYYFSKQLICILYTYSLNIQTTKTSSVLLEIIINTFDCMLTLSLSTQIFILAIVPLLFISVSILFEFAMLPDLNILLSPQEEEVHSSSWGDRYTHLAEHSSKRLHPLSVIILLCLGNTEENKTASSLVVLL